MPSFTAVVERDRPTGLYVGYVPGWPGAHSQAPTREELTRKLRDVLGLLLLDGAPVLPVLAVDVETITLP